MVEEFQHRAQVAVQKVAALTAEVELANRHGRLLDSLSNLAEAIKDHAADVALLGGVVTDQLEGAAVQLGGFKPATEEELKGRFETVLALLEPAAKAIKAATKSDMPAAVKNELVTLYEAFVESCAKECGIKRQKGR